MESLGGSVSQDPFFHNPGVSHSQGRREGQPVLSKGTELMARKLLHNARVCSGYAEGMCNLKVGLVLYRARSIQAPAHPGSVMLRTATTMVHIILPKRTVKKMAPPTGLPDPALSLRAYKVSRLWGIHRKKKTGDT